MASTLEDLLEALKRLLEDNKDSVDANYPPTLSGTPATEFTDNADDAVTTADDILADSWLSGITPGTESQPGGTSMSDWFFDLASDALMIYQSGGGTTPEKQELADQANTVKVNKTKYVNEYT